MDPTLAEDQLLMIYRTDGERTGGEQTLEIEFRDFGYTRYDGEDPNGEDVVLVPGTWTIPVELRFRAIREMEIGRKIQADGCAFTLDRIRLSALSVGLDIHCGQEDAEHLSELLDLPRSSWRTAERWRQSDTAWPARERMKQAMPARSSIEFGCRWSGTGSPPCASAGKGSSLRP